MTRECGWWKGSLSQGLGIALVLLGAGVRSGMADQDPPQSANWRFDNLQTIGGNTIKVVGKPRIIETPQGRAIEFNGVNDVLYLNAHPLAGAKAFTWEVIFRPDPGGDSEQRFFHLQSTDAAGRDDRRQGMLLEIRANGSQWSLDSFAVSGSNEVTLLDLNRRHSLGEWHAVAMVYDGRHLRHYVDGVEQGTEEIELKPQSPGRCSVGAHLNRVSPFKGAIRLARMTHAALAPADLLKVSDQ